MITWARIVGWARRTIRHRILGASPELDAWEVRAQQFGPRAVFNLGHSDAEVSRVTALQKSILFPVLQRWLTGHEHLVLDLGCGIGRFTPDLARLIAGRAVGVDPIRRLLEMAPQAPGVEYLHMDEGRIPLPADSADVVWICLVLGGLNDHVLSRTVQEVQRVLRPEGLLVLAENTTDGTGSALWRFRPASTYENMFPSVALEHVLDYRDLGDRISVYIGRKHVFHT